MTELVSKAGEARAEKRYDEAIELLKKAYDLYPDPRLLFNTAKVYHDSEDCQNALTYYIRTSEIAATKPKEFAELHAAVEEALSGFQCGDDREMFTALLLSYAESPHPIVAMKISAEYEKQGECVKAREMAVRASDSALASPETRSQADAAIGRLSCPDEDGDGDGASISTMNYVAYGLGGLGVASIILAIIVDQGTLADIDEFDTKLEPAFKASCPTREALANDPACKAAYARASDMEDEIASGQGTTMLSLGAGVLFLGAGATLWYLENMTDVFHEQGEQSIRLLPVISDDAIGGVLRIELD